MTGEGGRQPSLRSAALIGHGLARGQDLMLTLVETEMIVKMKNTEKPMACTQITSELVMFYDIHHILRLELELLQVTKTCGGQ